MLDQFKNVTRKRAQALLAPLVALVAAITGCDQKPNGGASQRTAVIAVK